MLEAAAAGLESERKLVEDAERAAAEQLKKDKEEQNRKNYQYALQKRAEMAMEARKQDRKIERLAKKAAKHQQRQAKQDGGFVESDSSEESPDEEPQEPGMRVKSGGQFIKRRMLRAKHASRLSTVAEGMVLAQQACRKLPTR